MIDLVYKLKTSLGAEKGVSMLLAILLVSAILAAAVGITSSLIVLLQISGRVQESAAAFYAAETGIEWQLYEVRIGSTSVPVLSNGATYSTTYASGSPNIVKSLGVFKKTSRGIEASFD